MELSGEPGRHSSLVIELNEWRPIPCHVSV